MVLGGILKIFSLLIQYVQNGVITSECQGHQKLALSIDTFSALLTIHPKSWKTHQACSPTGQLVSEVNISVEKFNTRWEKGEATPLVCNFFSCFQMQTLSNDMKNLSCLNWSNVSGSFDGSYGNLTFL